MLGIASAVSCQEAIVKAKPRKHLSTIDAARMLGVAASSISKWIDEGELVAGRTPGGHRRIEKADFVRFLNRQGFPVPVELHSSSARILIVDDDPGFAKWLAEQLGARYPQSEIGVACDGYSAGELVGLLKPTVAILGLQMPGIDGFEVCRRIKSNPSTLQTSVIAISATPDMRLQARITKLGVFAHLVKPFGIDALFVQIDLALAKPA